MLTKKAVLWDLDDTLYSRRQAARAMYPDFLREYVYENPGEEFLQEAVAFLMSQMTRSMTDIKGFQALLTQFPGDKPFDHAKCLEYYYAHILSYARPAPGASEILKNLKDQGVRLALVTNITPELLEHQRKKVETLCIGDFFDAIVYSAELGVHKPDRRIFDHAAKLLGVSNEECLFVGDDPDSDIAGALNAGMEAVWVDHRQTDDRFRDDPRVHRVHTLLEYFHI